MREKKRDHGVFRVSEGLNKVLQELRVRALPHAPMRELTDGIHGWKQQVSDFRYRQSEASLLQGFSSGSQLEFALNILWDSLLGFQEIIEISKHL